ncbi:hypothetical protein HGRIS_013351 [Hohenbuehelia grisea]|uniref:Uncharacterized protein n=1 Tax=Hohenbuehelia grisea TaxID=104357 RepID=A0ABR3IVF1_9AGAR
MDILKEEYPEYEHILLYDNATIHLKRPDGSLSATKVQKNTLKPEKNWLVEVTQRDENGNPVYTPAGTKAKTKIQMHGAHFNGHPQSLYFPNDHPTSPGVFKGMACILEERGFEDAKCL